MGKKCPDLRADISVIKDNKGLSDRWYYPYGNLAGWQQAKVKIRAIVRAFYIFECMAVKNISMPSKI